jgi:hypothetical protein
MLAQSIRVTYPDQPDFRKCYQTSVSRTQRGQLSSRDSFSIFRARETRSWPFAHAGTACLFTSLDAFCLRDQGLQGFGTGSIKRACLWIDQAESACVISTDAFSTDFICPSLFSKSKYETPRNRA